MDDRIQRTMNALSANKMKPYYAESSAEACEIVRGLVAGDKLITSGGSVTLKECGVIEMLKNEFSDAYLDRSSGKDRDAVEEIMRKAFVSDTFLASTNALTENGELYNVDGNSNRVAAIAYGPDSVIVVAGYNKIVADLNAASVRVKKMAAPPNTMRLDCDTPCAKTGECAAFAVNSDEMTAGCATDGRICCNYLISARQRHKNRIKVILVAESLGF